MQWNGFHITLEGSGLKYILSMHAIFDNGILIMLYFLGLVLYFCNVIYPAFKRTQPVPTLLSPVFTKMNKICSTLPKANTLNVFIYLFFLEMVCAHWGSTVLLCFVNHYHRRCVLRNDSPPIQLYQRQICEDAKAFVFIAAPFLVHR